MEEPRTEDIKEAQPAEESAEAAPKQVKPAPVQLKGGTLAPQNANELVRTLENIAVGGGFPDRFDTREKRIAAYNLAHSLMGAQWQLALNHIAIIKGQMSIYGEMPGTLAERTGEVDEKIVYVVDADYKKICTENKNLGAEVFAAVCHIKRKGRELQEFTYTMDEARKAEQYPPMKFDRKTQTKVRNLDSPWEKHLKIMLMRKAQAAAIKIVFPEALAGVPIAEYDFDEAPDLKDVTPRGPSLASRAEELNQRFTSKEENTPEATVQ